MTDRTNPYQETAGVELSGPLSQLKLRSPGTRAMLEGVGIATVGQLVLTTERELSFIRHFRKKHVKDVREALAAHNLTLHLAEA